MQIRRVIRRPEVLERTGLSATTIYKLERRGEFPAHFMLTPRCAAWDEAEVNAWIEARRAAPAKLDTSLRKSALGRWEVRAVV